MIASLASGAGDAVTTRVLHFPADRSLGKLYDMSRRAEFWPERQSTAPRQRQRLWRGYQPDLVLGSYVSFEELGEVRGNVVVAPGARLRLVIDAQAAQYNFSPLEQLAPDDIYSLDFRDGSQPLLPGQIEPLFYLTGLRELKIGDAELSVDHLTSLSVFNSIEKLELAIQDLGSTGIAALAQLKSVRGLRLYTRLRLTREDFSNLAKMQNLEALSLDVQRFEPEGYGELARLPRLRELHIGEQECTGSMFAHLPKLPHLEYLGFHDLNGTGVAALPPIPQLKQLSIAYEGQAISAAALASLAGYPRLEYLHLVGRVYDEGIAQLRSLQQLKTLSIHGQWQDRDYLTDQALATIGDLPRLENLVLYTGDFTDLGIKHLSRLRLRVLDMPNTREVSDAGLEHLGRMTTLERVQLRGDRITDDGLKHLYGLQALEELFLFSYTRVTESGVAELKERLPQLQVVEYRTR